MSLDFTKANINEDEKSLLLNMTEQEYIRYIYDEYYIRKHLSMTKIGIIFGNKSHWWCNQFKKYNLKARNHNEKGKLYHCDKDYFETIDTEEKAYWLGFLYADGFIQSKTKDNSRKVGLSLGIKDIEHLEKFKKCLKSNYPIKIYTNTEKSFNPNGQYCRIIITEEKMASDLENKGCIEHKTNILTFPSEDILSYNLQKHFIRGYFDGDGSIWCTLNKGNTIPTYNIDYCGTDELLTGIMNVLIKEKVIKRGYKFDKRKEGQIVSRFRFGGNQAALLFCHYIYDNATIYLQRKYDRYQELLEWINKKTYDKICCVCGDTESFEYEQWHHGGEYDGKVLCHRHYLQLKRHGEITKIEKDIKIKDFRCDICQDEKSRKYHIWTKDGKFKNKTLCSKHYYQLRYYNGELKDPTPQKH